MLASKNYTDKFGNEIILSQDTERHIRDDHPEALDDDIISITLSEPDILVKSSQDFRSVEYYKLTPTKWSKVVVISTRDGLFIKTSHYAKRLSRGEWLWRNPEYHPTQKEIERNSGSEPPTDSPNLWPGGMPSE